MNHILKICLLFFLFPVATFAQEKDAYDKKYEWRIRQEVLYNVYIPRDISDAVLQLNKLTDAESKTKYKAMTEEEVTRKLFFSLGRWITYNWSLFDGSRLSVHMQSIGIYHPDEMARFLMILFHRSLHKKPLQVKELLQQFQEKAKKDKQEKLKKGTIIHEETRQLERPPELKNGGQ